jgi:putative ABC transport system permease protein
MIANYFKIAYRHLMKHKAFSFINIFGLSVGLTCCMLISIYIFNEVGYDKHHKNGNRVFQVGTININERVETRRAKSSAPLGRMLQQDLAGIEASTRLINLWGDDKTLIQVKGDNSTTNSFYEQKGFVADSNFFSVITFPFKEGDPQSALAEPNSIVIKETLAQKLFGDGSALNKIVSVSSSTNGDNDFKVTGVFSDPSTPSHIDANFFLPFSGGGVNEMANDNPSLANNNMFYTYLLLREGVDPANVEQNLPAFVQRHLGEELKARGEQRNYFITPVSGIHLAGIENNVTPGGDKTALFILGSIAILTLLIACINFMNLSTACSAKRAAEVGIRKVLGAQKTSLLRQFLGESLLMAGIALLFAILLTILLLPVFQEVAGKTLVISIERHLPLIGLFVLLAIITGLMAGSYPAFYLSSFKPISVLKGKFSNSLRAVSLRKGLVVFQFVISISLIVASLVIAAQMKYLRSKDLGFVKDQQVVIPLRSQTAKDNIEAFKSDAKNNPSVQSIGATRVYPGIPHSQDWGMYRQGQTAAQSNTVFINMVDDDFLQTLGLKLVAGRLFSEQFPADTLTRFVVNEETVKQFGFASPEDAVGKWLAFEPDGAPLQFTIIGVVKNFHFKDLHETIQPIAFRMYNAARFNYMVAHIGGADVKTALSSLENTWKKVNPNEPFDYSFLDQDFQKNYEAETRQASLINSFTIVAIIISCLGLFGLAAFSAEQRTKEIGIRKVLGASVASVVSLLSKDFLKLVLVAVCIALPLAWYGMNSWLQSFSYRVDISWQVLALTIALSLSIAFITISFQALKSAAANPIKNLRSE